MSTAIRILIAAVVMSTALVACVLPAPTPVQPPTAQPPMSQEEARAIAANSECAQVGQLKDTAVYNENTGTWWIDLAAEKEGCNPACVVNVSDKTAEVNWRCTGLVQPTVAPEAAKPAEQVLTVWDVWTRPEEIAVIDEINKDFEAAHPGVTIKSEHKSFDDLKATAKLALSSADGPDMVQINQGWSDMGAMVQGGILTDLTPFVQQYGWDKKISQGIRARNSFTPDGKTFGEGNLYGVPATAELVGVYYRKDIFDKLGLKVPKTLDEFEATLAKLKEAGYVPLTFGNTDGWPAGQTYGEILNTKIKDRAYLDDLIYAWNKGASWDTPEQIESAKKLVEWADNGYFTKGYEGIKYEDSLSMFDNGEGAMMLTGSWASSTFQAGPNGDKIGFFLLPPAKEGDNKLSIGGTSLAYAIRQGSANTELAAEYINTLMSDKAAETWANAGTVPLAPVDPKVLKQGTLFADLVTAWNDMNQRDAVGHYLDWASPTFYDTLVAGLQELLAKQITPEDLVKKFQADREAFLQQQGK